ncbi:MAG: IclR family transcriptional regulator [Blautia sp.]
MAQDTLKMETIQAVDRAFQVLETISRQGSVSPADLSRQLKISKASLSRLLYTMVQNGYLEMTKNNEYTMTLKSYEVGINALQNLDKLSLINSALVELNRETGRIAQFSIDDNNQLLCIQSMGQSGTSFSVYTNVGKRTPLYCTSAGKAILAAYTNSDIVDRWESFSAKPLTTHTITDLQEFLKEIAQVRKCRYALDREESEYQLFCVGAAVMDHTGFPIGAISLSGSSLTQEEEEYLSDAVIQSSQRLSGLLGYVK